MTVMLNNEEMAVKILAAIAGSEAKADTAGITVSADSVFKVAEYLKTAPGLEFDYLANLTAVDYMDYFEVIYNLVSLSRNHKLCLKARCPGREKPSLPSVVSLWQSADYQEREVYDLMGIHFTGHPNLKRLLLWEGFQGHPLRRDYL